MASHVAPDRRTGILKGLPPGVDKPERAGLTQFKAGNRSGLTAEPCVSELAVVAGVTLNELVQWMVEDASLDR